jgi:hypothetical protein
MIEMYPMKETEATIARDLAEPNGSESEKNPAKTVMPLSQMSQALKPLKGLHAAVSRGIGPIQL